MQVLISRETDDGTVTYSYTSDGKLESVKDSLGTTKYIYDSMNGLTKVEYPNGKYISYRLCEKISVNSKTVIKVIYWSD